MRLFFSSIIIGSVVFVAVMSTAINAEVVIPADSVEIVEAAPPTTVIAEDNKYDNATQINISWVPSIDESLSSGKVIGYRLYRSVNGGVASKIADIPLTATEDYYQDQDVFIAASEVKALLKTGLVKSASVIPVGTLTVKLRV